MTEIPPLGVPALQEQLRVLIQRMERPLVSYTLRMTGDLELARDVVQEAFLRLCARDISLLQEELSSQGSIPWLFTVCRHLALDLNKKERRMLPTDIEQMDRLHSQASSPSIQVEQKQHLHHIKSIIETLPEDQQEVVFLKFQHGMSYKQISEVTSLSVSHVGVLLHTAMKGIRQKLKQEGRSLFEKGGLV